MADDVRNVTREDCKHHALLYGANVFEISELDKSNCVVYKCHPDYINFIETSTITDLYFVGRFVSVFLFFLFFLFFYRKQCYVHVAIEIIRCYFLNTNKT